MHLVLILNYLGHCFAVRSSPTETTILAEATILTNTEVKGVVIAPTVPNEVVAKEQKLQPKKI